MPSAQIVQPHETMTAIEQNTLSVQLVNLFEVFLRTRNKSDVAGLSFLLAFAWGWAKRCGIDPQELVNRADRQWAACSDVDARRVRTSPVERTG